ncbi:MAG TPA: ATP-binding cassette domain-containing protein [Candidatus Methylomirabilis sp.]|nr:ATP-binding cassette domain-containing protein [Candidatus Methylomirabilis sp.]
MNVLETEGLTRRFGDLTAVDGVTISVEAREVFALLGANGAGKTVTLKMLTTLLRPSAGNARVAGFDIVHHAAEVRRVIGYVPQLVSADGALTGYENLLIFAKLYDIPRAERKERILDALAFMGLSEVSDKLVRGYSGGMIRRLEIAEAMLHCPPVLFLDEPTVGLDPVAREAVWQRVHDLRQRYGTTIIFTTHLMEEADHLCTRLAVMHRGRVVAIGTPAELKAAVGGTDTTLDGVFIHYAEGAVEAGGTYREISQMRRTAKRLG